MKGHQCWTGFSAMLSDSNMVTMVCLQCCSNFVFSKQDQCDVIFACIFVADKYKGLSASNSAAGGKSENPMDSMDCEWFFYYYILHVIKLQEDLDCVHHFTCQ